jgi:hypothetical protein
MQGIGAANGIEKILMKIIFWSCVDLVVNLKKFSAAEDGGGCFSDADAPPSPPSRA